LTRAESFYVQKADFVLQRMTHPDTRYQQIVSLSDISIGPRFGCIRTGDGLVRRRELVMLQYTLVLLSGVMRDREGVSSLEYAILAFGIIGAVFAGVGLLGTEISGMFGHIIDNLKADTGG
jgi:Flp pilus assembly pilin Flp